MGDASDPAQPHRVVALCLDQVGTFDLSSAAQVFSVAGDFGWRSLYSFETCAERAGSVRTLNGFSLEGVAGLDALERADTIVVPGYRAVVDPIPGRVCEALRAAADHGTRIVSICTGAFALGYAGVLDGRRATTHWHFADDFARLFPLVDLDPDALYVDEDQILTSAGLSAGIDLCLHVVRRDYGEEIGAEIARAMVASPHRDGGQAQFIDRPLPCDDGSLQAVRDWALDHLAEPIDVGTMARRAGVSPRTFARRFVDETGTTPLSWLLHQRVLEARRLLESTELPIEDVATRAGFGSAPSLREHFRRATSTSPTSYRRTFRGAATTPPIRVASG